MFACWLGYREACREQSEDQPVVSSVVLTDTESRLELPGQSVLMQTLKWPFNVGFIGHRQLTTTNIPDEENKSHDLKTEKMAGCCERRGHTQDVNTAMKGWNEATQRRNLTPNFLVWISALPPHFEYC